MKIIHLNPVNFFPGVVYTDKFLKLNEVWVGKLEYSPNNFKKMKKFFEDRFPKINVTANADTKQFFNTRITLLFSDPAEEAEFILYQDNLEVDLS
jgi:hypothetical protein